MRKFFLLLTVLFLSVKTQIIAQTIINVDPSQAGLLSEIINTAQPGSWILLADGTYQIPIDYLISVDSILITSSSGNPESVVINGDGMNGSIYYGFFIMSDNITISNVTIQNVRSNCIRSGQNINGLHLNNCILKNAGEFFISISSSHASNPSENGIIEYCLFEYPDSSGVSDYMGGINGRYCKNWIVRNNIFRFIRSPSIGGTAYAVLFCDSSEANLVEKNYLIDCDRGIGFGLGDQGNNGGIIRNNIIYHRNIIENDQKGIILESSPYTQIYNNTIYLDQDVLSSIECRFNTSVEIFIANNLTNKPIIVREGASAIDTSNVISSLPFWFKDLTSGDLHLSSDTLSAVIDRGMTMSGLVEDIDGDPRPQGSGIDIGADEFTSSTDIGWYDNVRVLPKTVQLNQNYPNPFNASTKIEFRIPQNAFVTLKIFNILGKEVAMPFSGELIAGSHRFEFSASNLASGVYLYRLSIGSLTGEAEDQVKTRKMIFLK